MNVGGLQCEGCYFIGYDASKNPNLQRADMVHRSFPHQLPSSLHIVPQTPQVRGLHTFIRNRKTPRYLFSLLHNKVNKSLIPEGEGGGGVGG